MSTNNFPTSSVYCHRGHWLDKSEQNSVESFVRAQKSGLAVETDIRDIDQKIRIAHDVSSVDATMAFEDYLKLQIRTAINTKSDGLASLLSSKREEFIETDSFIFDGSIPQMLMYRNLGLPHALRLSEYEKELPWETNYIWLDAFHSDWWIRDNILEKYRSSGEKIVLVSPEIHGRNPEDAWAKVYEQFFDGNRNVSVCTDRPIDFLNYG